VCWGSSDRSQAYSIITYLADIVNEDVVWYNVNIIEKARVIAVLQNFSGLNNPAKKE